MYRPENPYSKKHIREFNASRLTCIMDDGTFMDDLLRMEKERAYGEALDAMLEGLRKEQYLLPDCNFHGYDSQGRKGALVFIPDEQVKKDD
jgi:hypothetical protein